MTAFFDPLALAVGVVSAWATNDDLPDWADVYIYRLLCGGGWMLTVRRTGIILDHELQEVAA